ncbi:MAG: SpoIID/LytB domain-containing protein [Gemmatimonadales bacterium]
MATTAADTGVRGCQVRRWGAAFLVAVASALTMGSCTPTAGPRAPSPEQPAGQTSEPLVRIGLAVGAVSAVVSGDSGLAVTDPSGARLAAVSPGESWRVAAAGSGVAMSAPGGGSTLGEIIDVAGADAGALVRINGRAYRGMIEIFRDRTGITIVNRLPIETYLLGVVSTEMGRRAPTELEALRAQAVVSRTYALRHLRRWDVQGFDLYATVADQVYGGAERETPEGNEAVTATRGRILTYDGQPIDAFFYSTCGGRTADGTEVFQGADRPYLRSLPDVADNGIAYCSISPRFRWREAWSGDELRATLRQTLPTLRVPSREADEVSDVRVAYRTPSGRVGRLTIGLRGSEVQVDGPNVRQVLRSTSGDILRSNAFTITATRSGSRVTRLVADGAGAGHGVGFCQWGAVGRSRAGQDYGHILAAYYPGTALERLY